MLFSKTLFMMLFHTKYHFIVTGTTLNITEQEIVDVKRNFKWQYCFACVKYRWKGYYMV